MSDKERLLIFLHYMPNNLGIYGSALNSDYEIALIIFSISLHCTEAGYNKYINLNFSRRASSVLILMHLVTVDLMDAFNI